MMKDCTAKPKAKKTCPVPCGIGIRVESKSMMPERKIAG